jgi:predicted N-formylglutamate amidohydrolase
MNDNAGEYRTHKQHRQTGLPEALLDIREENIQQQQKKCNVNAEFYAEQPACVNRPFHNVLTPIYL